MNRSLISIVIETITREDYAERSLADDLQPTLDAVARQTYPGELIETIVVVDPDLTGRESDEVIRRYPAVTIVCSLQRNYFAAKNAGARAAQGSIVALIDGDCVPGPDWLATLTAPFADAEVSGVAGATRYAGRSLSAWTYSVPDFAIVVGDKSGAASAFNLNNSAFRREVLLANPLEARIRRDGGCFLLYHQLRAAGARIMYAPKALVHHGLDFAGKGLLKKHFNRGFDGVTVYRADERAVLRGTRLFRRFGALALIVFVLRRIVVDWLRLIRYYDQMGISPVTIPYFAAVSVVTRLIALTGGLTAVFRTGHAPLTTTAASR
ncbi:MAG TPA: glycosyltransferase [Thermoanaerobaculia bacterium]|jgi:GT2 family glycosyltransferase|nr:glycosyltransferase [Thermoanaerobaculia bacterium]